MQWAAELSILCIIQLISCHSDPIIRASFSANCLTSSQSKLVCHRAPRCNSPATLLLSPLQAQKEKLFAQNWFSRVPPCFPLGACILFQEAELDYFGTLLLVATVGSYEEKVRKLRKYCCLCRIKLFYYVSTTLEAVCSDKKPFKCESFSVDNELGNMLVSHWTTQRVHKSWLY